MTELLYVINVVKIFSDRAVETTTIGCFTDYEKLETYLASYISAKKLTEAYEDCRSDNIVYFDDADTIVYFGIQLLTVNPELRLE